MEAAMMAGTSKMPCRGTTPMEGGAKDDSPLIDLKSPLQMNAQTTKAAGNLLDTPAWEAPTQVE